MTHRHDSKHHFLGTCIRSFVALMALVPGMVLIWQGFYHLVTGRDVVLRTRGMPWSTVFVYRGPTAMFIGLGLLLFGLGLVWVAGKIFRACK